MAQPSANIFHDVAKLEEICTILVLVVQLEALRHARVKLKHIVRGKLKEINLKVQCHMILNPWVFKLIHTF
jgi:hypothetical protein